MDVRRVGARDHDGLAYAHRALNQPEQARGHWQHALEILEALGVDNTDEEETYVAAIRDHLAHLDRRDDLLEGARGPTRA